MKQDVSRETYERLNAYKELLIRWNAKINLVAPSTIQHIWQRHIEDCLQIARLAKPERGVWADLGSGGGLPGIVVAVAVADMPITFTLVESDKRKAAFLRTAIRNLALKNVSIINDRIESVSPLNADIVSARALAPLPKLLSYVKPHLAPTGRAWLMKGARWEDEISNAKRIWAFNYQAFPSKSEPEAAILQVDGIRDA